MLVWRAVGVGGWVGGEGWGWVVKAGGVWVDREDMDKWKEGSGGRVAERGRLEAPAAF